MIPGDDAARSAAPGPVTLAVVNARVWTGDPRRPWADAVVARGDRLAFVGSGAEARKLTRDAPDARVIDAGGRFLAAPPDRPPLDTPRVLRAGEPASFVLTDRDPSRPTARGGDGGGADAHVVLAVADGRVGDPR